MSHQSVEGIKPFFGDLNVERLRIVVVVIKIVLIALQLVSVEVFFLR